MIDFLEIQHIRKTPVGRLPYGLQKRVELARALAAEPSLLLLDEPMAGMNVEEKQDMCRFVLDVNEQFGTTIVLIEHDMGVVMDISDRVVVLDYGKKIGDGAAGRDPRQQGGDRRVSRRRALGLDMSFFFEVLIGGLLSGVMYSLVALGFVLIYKASGVFNFAQGAMVFFAALTYVGLLELGLPPWPSVPATLAVMVVLGLAIERVVLRPLVNQPQITLFMATIGLSFFIEGLAQIMWGANVRGLELGLQDEPMQWLVRRDRHERVEIRRRGRRRRGDTRDVARALLQPHADRPRAARGRRRPPGRARGRHSAAADLGHRLGGRRVRRARRRPALGRAQRRPVRADVRRAEGAAGADPGRLRVDSRRDRRRSHHRRDREACRGLPGPVSSAAASKAGSRTCSRSCSC